MIVPRAGNSRGGVAPGFIGQAAFNAADVVSVVVEGETARYRQGSDADASGPTSSTDTAFRAGLRAGSHPGLAGMLLMGVLVGMFALSDGGGLGW